jgi:hypothetical protein
MTERHRLPKALIIIWVMFGGLFCLAVFSPIRIAIHNLIWNLHEPDEYSMIVSVSDHRGYAQGVFCVKNGVTVSKKISEGEYGLPALQPWEWQSVMGAMFTQAHDCAPLLECSVAFANHYHYPEEVTYHNEYVIRITNFATRCPNER